MPKAQRVPKESNSTKSTESEKGKKRGHKSPEILLTLDYINLSQRTCSRNKIHIEKGFNIHLNEKFKTLFYIVN